MKVLSLIDSLGSGGAQRQIVSVSKLLKQKGIDVSVLVYYHNDFRRGELDEYGIPLIECYCRNGIKRMLKVRQVIRNGHYDAVISFMDTPNFLNCFAAIGGHKWKVITSERSSNEGIFKGAQHKLYNYLQRFSDALICNSENAVSMWHRHFPNYDGKLHCIYNAVVLPETKTQYTPRKDGKTHIVVPAGFRPVKNAINVAKALSLLTDPEKQLVQIDWYGAHNEANTSYPAVLDIIQKNKLESCFVLHDATNDIASIINQSDAVGLFSILEGLPNAICEGMMIGKPIIMSKVSDYNTLVDSSNGFLCEWNDINSIAKALESIANIGIDDLLSMGHCSQQKAKELFEPNIIANRWVNLINSFV